MHRRRFLALSAATGFALGAGRVEGAAPAGPAAAAVVVTDISPGTDAAALFAVLKAFGRGGLAVTCALGVPDDGTPESYAGIVQGVLALGPAIEIALDLPDLGNLSPYFQGRAVFEARRRLAALTGGDPPVEVRSVLCRQVEDPTNPVGVRSAGARNVLVRPGPSGASGPSGAAGASGPSGPIFSEAWANGVARFSGGTWLAPDAVPLLPDGGAYRLFYLSAERLADVSLPELRRWAGELAAAFLDAELRGAMTAMRVSELQLRDNFGFTRHVALRLVGDSPALRALAGKLAQRSFPALTQPDPATAGYWVPEPGRAGGATGAIALARVICDPAAGLSVPGAEALPPGIAVLPVMSAEGTPGMDACAALELRDLPVTAPVPSNTPLIPPDEQDDLLISIHPGALAGPGAERVLLAALDSLAQDGVTRFVPLDGLVNTVLSQDPIEARFRRTRAAALSAEPAAVVPGPAEAALYRDDARLAWAFFEAFTDPNTGLCPATANVDTGGDALTRVTMWDVGSQINALVAAHRLGLVETAGFEAGARRILHQIAGARSQGRLLPNGVIRTDVVRSGSRDFDGCDAGRLLAALDNLRRNATLDDEIAALVASWDLDQIVIDGKIHSVTDGALKSTFKSHCAHYAARAFGRWGLRAGSPYQTLAGRSEADGRMALLEAVARIGPLGAEPLLLEVLELGPSPESDWLADVLHVAQVEEYKETGTLVAVSEMPIARAPWFVYLGLQLGRDPREWGIDVVGGGAEYQSREFLEQNMALSTKAAYLWAACRPGVYADALVAFMRAHARLRIGFASNVSAGKKVEAAPFTDLNTNAVILEAIAYKLLGDGALTRP